MRMKSNWLLSHYRICYSAVILVLTMPDNNFLHKYSNLCIDIRKALRYLRANLAKKINASNIISNCIIWYTMTKHGVEKYYDG